jgi:hypothetical protein
MDLFDNFGETILAVVMAAAAAVLSALATEVAVIWIGARLFKGESSYGFGLSVGPPLAIAAGIAIFIWVFRKMRITG